MVFYKLMRLESIVTLICVLFAVGIIVLNFLVDVPRIITMILFLFDMLVLVVTTILIRMKLKKMLDKSNLVKKENIKFGQNISSSFMLNGDNKTRYNLLDFLNKKLFLVLNNVRIECEVIEENITLSAVRLSQNEIDYMEEWYKQVRFGIIDREYKKDALLECYDEQYRILGVFPFLKDTSINNYIYYSFKFDAIYK